MSNPAFSISCCAVSLVLQLFRQLDSWWMERGVAPTAIKLAVGISDREMCLGDGSSSTSPSSRFLTRVGSSQDILALRLNVTDKAMEQLIDGVYSD